MEQPPEAAAAVRAVRPAAVSRTAEAMVQMAVL
jgi:hypothetical protein